jgi:hypothetical protein
MQHAYKSREKVFGAGRPRPMDRNAKARLMTLARALMRRREKGKAYGPVTAKALAVFEALLWGFHNARTGLCFPSLARLAERAECARSTVQKALDALETLGLLFVGASARPTPGARPGGLALAGAADKQWLPAHGPSRAVPVF